MYIARWLYRRVLRQPYDLSCRVDAGHGQPVLLLHGIASSGEVWHSVAEELSRAKLHLLVFDLLGFGNSPKPTDKWIRYTVREHAQAVILTLQRKGIRKPVVIAGHSMGCFVAIEVAALRPDLVKHLLLYEPPFYTGLPEGNKYRRRQAMYFRLYEAFSKHPLGDNRFVLARRLLKSTFGFELDHTTWIPFQRSLRNTIMQQTALDDLKTLTVPTEVIYGKYDQFVIDDKQGLFFGHVPDNINILEVPEMHALSQRASRLIATKILQAVASLQPKRRNARQ